MIIYPNPAKGKENCFPFEKFLPRSRILPAQPRDEAKRRLGNPAAPHCGPPLRPVRANPEKHTGPAVTRQVRSRSSDSFKVLGAMLTQRADKVRGQLLPFIDIAANLAHPSLFLGQLGLGLRFDMGKVVRVGHRGHLGQNPRLGHIGHKQGMGSPILCRDHFTGNDCVGELGQMQRAVLTAVRKVPTGELVGVPAALEAKMLENGTS